MVGVEVGRVGKDGDVREMAPIAPMVPCAHNTLLYFPTPRKKMSKRELWLCEVDEPITILIAQSHSSTRA